MDAEEPRKRQACTFVSPRRPAEGTPLIHSGVARTQSHVVVTGEALRSWVVPEAALAAGVKTRATLLLASGPFLLHACENTLSSQIYLSMKEHFHGG